MFNKLKQVKDLRSQAKQMQNALAGEKIIIERKGVSVEIKGNMEIVNISINDDIAKENLEGILKDNINEALKKTQKIMATKMQEMGGLSSLGL